MNRLAAAVSATFLLLPASAGAAVDFVKDVKPILETKCLPCHRAQDRSFLEGRHKLSLESRALALAAAQVIVPGRPEQSRLYTATVAGDAARELMPPRHPFTGQLQRLSREDTEILRQWIAGGAAWPDGVVLAPRTAGAARYPDDTPELIAAVHARIVAGTKEATAPEMKPYTETILNSDSKFDLIPIPGGRFKMGSPDGERGHRTGEGPVHEAELAPFWMGRCEVSWDEYLLFMDHEEELTLRKARRLTDAELTANRQADATTHPTAPYHDMTGGMGTAGFPAISMTQHGANKYCQWLSAKTGHFYRLPTEAEWEYAARAGTTTAYFWGDDPAPMGEYCWWGKNSEFSYHKVGRKKPNPWGLCDMLGNVAEWTLDQYDAGYYAQAPALTPWNKATQPYPHALRGGSYDDDDPTALRCAARLASTVEWKRSDPQLPKSIWHFRSASFIGFRVVRPLKVPTAGEMSAYWNSGVHRDDPGQIEAGR